MSKHINKASCEATPKMSYYQPDQEVGGFGTGRHFSPDSGLETIKTDPNAYSKIIRGGTRTAAKHFASHPSQLLASHSHHAKAPQVDKQTVAKYTHPVKPRSHAEKPQPSVALTYGDPLGRGGQEPVFGFRFNSAKAAFHALVKKEISLVSWVNIPNHGKGEMIPAYSLRTFLGA